MKYIFGGLFFFILLGFISFREIPFFYFFSDDFVWLLEAKRHSISDIPSYLYDSGGFFYRPTTKFYFWVMWQLFQADPLAYHVANLILHFLVTLVIFFLSLLFFPFFSFRFAQPADRFLVASGIALLFFVHPAHYEAVVWPSGITELIPALCVLIGMLLCGRYFLLFYKHSLSWFTLFLYLFFIFFFFVVGLGAHEYVVVFPALVFVLHVVISRIFSFILLWQHNILYLTLIFIELGYFVLRFFANSHWSGGDYSYNLVLFPFNFFGNLFGYLGLFLFGISFISWHFFVRTFFREYLFYLVISLGFVFVLSFVYFLYRIRLRYCRSVFFFVSRFSCASLFLLFRRFFLFFVGLCKRSSLFFIGCFSFVFFVLTLLPFLGLGGIAERYLYLAAFGLCFFVGCGVYAFARFVERYTESISVFSAFALLIGAFLCFYVYSTRAGVESWRVASSLTTSLLEEFRENCDQFSYGQTIVRLSPFNRYERAWVFQVGYEEGANLYCDKNLRIVRQ